MTYQDLNSNHRDNAESEFLVSFQLFSDFLRIPGHADLTLQLVWQEARENNPDGYGYGRFL